MIKSFAQSKTSAVPPKMTVESGNFFFHYLNNSGVCYFTLAEKGYPKKLAYQYLEELFREFTSLYHSEIESVARPYAFIKFGAWALWIFSLLPSFSQPSPRQPNHTHSHVLTAFFLLHSPLAFGIHTYLHKIWNTTTPDKQTSSSRRQESST